MLLKVAGLLLCSAIAANAQQANGPVAAVLPVEDQDEQGLQGFVPNNFEDYVMKRSPNPPFPLADFADERYFEEDSMGKRSDMMDKRSLVAGRPGNRPGKRSNAIGRVGFRTEKRSLAIGRSSFRPGKRSIAFGRMGYRPGKRSLATGRVAFRPGKRSVAMGRMNYRPGKRSIAVGRMNFRPGKRSVEFFEDYCKRNREYS